ncbi:MAG TPA: RnfABCDGE type electron transport complex subunit D [Polyangiaceae bacterium]|jgi:electron transport complex protein RnfD|nr:MAG: Electron transport complex protein RnfD [Deltaproteobacteria bacterium ADurb.Bin207]HNS97238.1 RnfABCDGE type electron transport complex subunit D [Polyangiaceae bacterium]HNZ23116.1 RnfABCDGE type electron transport complex subunit D [Polyangiaceae bacterium]HOD22153.1 RnfABCDGE type electron transport complex subunit D [Polyangiaceae bacterium]HOE49397.1 RnfABCDGE type electron transport complex subunit D [Polyangiaceae bacterium]
MNENNPPPEPKAMEPVQPSPLRLLVGTSPHVHAEQGVPEIMRWVVLALLPAVAVSLWSFGLEALRVYVLAVGACLAIEWICLRIFKTPGSLADGSAAVTGVLLAMNLPPTSPSWMVLIGAVVAIVFAKHLFGGLGSNIFNPALTARVFLLISWPVSMTTWLKVGERGFISPSADLQAITQPTPLGMLKVGELQSVATEAGEWLLRDEGGSLGEVSALALVLGGVCLLWKRIITWEIPVFFIGTTVVFTAAAWLIDPSSYASPLTHALSGGLLLGAIFMATDMVTSPGTFQGRVIFAIGCGLLTAIIRLWGGYPEGVSFAILLMNGLTPLIDRLVRPRPHGAMAPSRKVPA